MQNLNYYVLWTKNSPLLKQYFEKYFQKLKIDLKYIIPESVYVQLEWSKDLRDFILNPDISSIINHIKRSQNQDSLEKLVQNIDIYLEEGITSEKLIQNRGCFIWDTHIRLTDFDNNPYNQLQAHPDHIKNKAQSWNWWEKSTQEWLQVYEKTFSLLNKVDTWIYDELNQIITKIMPFGTSNGIHNSCSYKECVWHLYMWYTIDTEYPEINILEAIIHESSHNKLNLLIQFDPLILNDMQEKYYSPYRPDARHMKGCFLWLHAFVPTMYICLKAYGEGHLWDNRHFLEKFILYILKNKICFKVVRKHGNLTPLWMEILEEIEYVISLTDIYIRKMSLSKDIFERAQAKIKKHFSEVNHTYPGLEY